MFGQLSIQHSQFMFGHSRFETHVFCSTLDSALSIHLLTMGSVSDDYQCPWCGRVGNGGYVMDGVTNYPLCTEGEYSCCFYSCMENNICCQHQYVDTALRQMRVRRSLSAIPDEPWTIMVAFLAGEIPQWILERLALSASGGITW